MKFINKFDNATIFILGSCFFKTSPTPVIVPPVPTPATNASIFPFVMIMEKLFRLQMPQKQPIVLALDIIPINTLKLKPNINSTAGHLHAEIMMGFFFLSHLSFRIFLNIQFKAFFKIVFSF